MKLFDYSTWSLFFTTILQAVSGYTCPNVNAINSKITENKTMRFPLAECVIPTRRGYAWLYRDNANQIQKFYNGASEVEEISAVYYQKPTLLSKPALTCFYKDKNKKFFSLVMEDKGVARVNTSAIESNCKYWRIFHSDGLYVCGEETVPKVHLKKCQFQLKTR
jgi:hypothetical protein